MKKIKSLFDNDGVLLYCAINIGLIISFWNFLANTSMGFEGYAIQPLLGFMIFWLGIEVLANLISIYEEKSRSSWIRSFLPIIIGIGLWIIELTM